MGTKTRLDQFLVEHGLVETLELARSLIMEGKVIVNEQRVDKVATLIQGDANVRLRDQNERFVSRGGEKLDGALKDLGISHLLKDAVVLDVGSSTGGFTDCCLAYGAKKVIALDVGTNQLAWKLRKDPRVVSLEKCDIRDFVAAQFEPVNWVVADISFNSVARLLPDLRRAAPHAGVHFLALIKPQFELDKANVGKGGVVEDDGLRQKAVEQVHLEFAKLGMLGGVSVASRLSGQKGNREIFYYVKS